MSPQALFASWIFIGFVVVIVLGMAVIISEKKDG
jgi:hypothetical protein